MDRKPRLGSDPLDRQGTHGKRQKKEMLKPF